MFMEYSGLVPPGGAVPSEVMTGIFRAVMAVTMVAMLGVTFFATALQVGVGELAVAGADGSGDGVGRRAYPWLLGGRQDTRGWKQAALYGLGFGLLSALVFWALDVKAGAALELVKRLFPKLAQLELPLSLTVMLPAVLLAAVSEELVFRGLMQGWLTRWLGGTRSAVRVSVGVSSALWAFAHWGNTDQPWLKVGQIFLCGLGLGALTRRYSVEASIVAHAVINLVAVAACLSLGV
jgi:membrane protease YdiL (CAAX protease family)